MASIASIVDCIAKPVLLCYNCFKMKQIAQKPALISPKKA